MEENMEEREYFTVLAAAYVRGHAQLCGVPELPDRLRNAALEQLTEEERNELVGLGKAADLKIYRFKSTHADLPRVKKVLGFLRGIRFESLLDIGSGRGVFLFPFLTEFPWVQVTSVDILPFRVQFLREIAAGGIDRLTALEANICDLPFKADTGSQSLKADACSQSLKENTCGQPLKTGICDQQKGNESCDRLPAENSVDVVTALEVFEHIPDVAAAVRAAVAIARKFVVVSVPSKPDNNPEHIHLLTKDRLTELFFAAGCTRLKFDGVNGHLILIAGVS